MENIKSFLKSHQQNLIILFGFLLVAGISFGLGRFESSNTTNAEVKVEQAFVSPSNYTPNVSGIQSTNKENVPLTPTATLSGSTLNCEGKIKGASSMIYHIPGDAFYKRTTKPIACFDTEAQALAAGFKKSSK